MDSANSSDFLIPNGGSLQSQPGTPQSSGSTNQFNFGSPLSQSDDGASRQDLLGEGLVVGQVSFSPSVQSAQTQPQPNLNDQNINLPAPWLLAIVLVAVVFVFFLSRKFVREN